MPAPTKYSPLRPRPPSAYCLLPTPYCLLPTAYSPLPSRPHSAARVVKRVQSGIQLAKLRVLGQMAGERGHAIAWNRYAALWC